MHHLHHNPPSADAGQRPARLLLPVLLLAQLMVILDISALNVALPNLARDLRIAPDEISWTITSYSVLFGSLLLLGGRAADLLGRRRVFFSGLTVFTASSLASAAAVSPAALFAARAGQGLGAAMLSPAALSIIMANYQGSGRARALGAWGAVGGAGAAVGVLVGGVLTQVADWRAIFYVNLPVALVAALAGRRASRPIHGRPASAASTSAARQSRPRASPQSCTRSARLRDPAGRPLGHWASGSPAWPVLPSSPPSNCRPQSRSCASSDCATVRSAAASH